MEIEDYFEKRHIREIIKYNRRLEAILNEASRDLARRILAIEMRYPETVYQGSFYKLNKAMKSRIDEILKQLHKDILANTTNGVVSNWDLANLKNNKLVGKWAEGIQLKKDSIPVSFYQLNEAALDAFLKRVEAGFTISERVWRLVNGARDQIELYLSSGISTGKPAADIARDIKKYLNEPNKLFRRIRQDGKLVLSKAARGYHPGAGIYRSSYKNALRLTRNETNVAYRLSDYHRRQQLDFIVGVEVHLSAAHPVHDLCDSLYGRYPKGFVFTGWHPQCYSSDTEVYTNNGWKYFRDLQGNDLILSLNPNTKNLEYSPIVRKIEYPYKGKMLRFYNRSLDMLVTPDHEMIGFNKYNNKLQKLSAKEYFNQLYFIASRNIYTSKNRLYRSSEWKGKNRKYIKVGKYKFSVPLFCEFMGYYLSEGSLSRKYAVTISQDKKYNPDNYTKMYQCLLDMKIGKIKQHKNGFNFYNKDIWEYLKPFGKSYQKYIPEEIKELSKEYIDIFLNAFCMGDGWIKKNRQWKNGKFRDSRCFSTSSKKMADDIGELILKIGHHPSFSLDNTKNKEVRFRNGVYNINNNQWGIRDCYSQYAVQFYREKVDYNDKVFDVEIADNHIIYVRRNGRCVWSSNCICYSTSILLNKKDSLNYMKTGKVAKSKYVNKIPKRAENWIDINAEKIKNYKNKPVWIKDNLTNDFKVKEKILKP